MEGTISNKTLAKEFKNNTVEDILFHKNYIKRLVGSEYRPNAPRWFQKLTSKRIARGFDIILRD